MINDLTICVTSYNRGKYLDVLLSSLVAECKEFNHQLIVIDNFSTEKRVFQTIENHKDIITNFVDRGKTNERQSFVNDEYHAKNIAIALAKNSKLLFLQDDLQYIAPVGTLNRYVKAFSDDDTLCLTCNAVRRSTLQNTVTGHYRINDINFYRHKDNHFHTMGFYHVNTFERFGKYPTCWPNKQEYWGRSEDWYDSRIKNSFDGHHRKISCGTFVPLFVPVWNDSRGGYAFLRDNKRYGEYKGPVNATLLYHQYTQDEFAALENFNKVLSFVDVAVPLNWKYAVENGDQVKYPQSKIMVEGPISEANDE